MALGETPRAWQMKGGKQGTPRRGRPHGGSTGRQREWKQRLRLTVTRKSFPPRLRYYKEHFLHDASPNPQTQNAKKIRHRF